MFIEKCTITAAYSFYTISNNNSTKKEIVTLVGNLCTATDIVAKDIELPTLECGDLIVINNAGSYAAVLSPMQFSSQVISPEYFLNKE